MIAIRNCICFVTFCTQLASLPAAQISNEGFIGSPFYGVTANSTKKIVNQVGPFADFAIPHKLNVRSDSNSLLSGEVTKLNASLRLDDGTISNLNPKNVTWTATSQDLVVKDGFLTAKKVSKNARVSIQATADGFSATLYIRLKSEGTIQQDIDDVVSSVKNALSDSVELEMPGWKKSSWLGSYFDGGNNWIHHQHHGWLFSFSDRLDSLWLWSPSQKWLWTGPALYPHMYRSKDGAWMYFIVQALPQKVYYNQSSKSLEMSE